MSEEQSEIDFFKEHENFELRHNESSIHAEGNSFTAASLVSDNDNLEKSSLAVTSEVASNSLGPSVKLSNTPSNSISERKSTIGVRKIQNKRPGVSI